MNHIDRIEEQYKAKKITEIENRFSQNRQYAERILSKYNRSQSIAERKIESHGLQKGQEVKRHIRHTKEGKSFVAGEGSGASQEVLTGSPSAAATSSGGGGSVPAILGPPTVGSFIPGQPSEMGGQPDSLAPPQTSIFNKSTNSRVARFIDDANETTIISALDSWESMEDSATKLEIAKMIVGKIVSEGWLQSVAQNNAKQEQSAKNGG